MNVLDHSQAFESSTSVLDSLDCDSVVRTTAQDLSVVYHYLVGRAAGVCAET